MSSEESSSVSCNAIDPLWTLSELSFLEVSPTERSSERGKKFVSKLFEYASPSPLAIRVAEEVAASPNYNGTDSAYLFAGYPDRMEERKGGFETQYSLELSMMERIYHAAYRVDEYPFAVDLNPEEYREVAFELYLVSSVSQLIPVSHESHLESYIGDLFHEASSF